MATESQSLEVKESPHVYISQLSNHVGETILLKGWLYNLRSSGKILFPQLRDGTGVVAVRRFEERDCARNLEALKAWARSLH